MTAFNHAHVGCDQHSILGSRDGGIPESQFSSLPRLRYLDLSNCSIPMLPMEIFNNNPNMKELR